jgi:hypothetical protein
MIGYGLDDQDSISGRGRNGNLHQHIQTGSGAHSVSYTVATGGSGGKVADA